jgi:signal transduction histidine kinase
MSYAATFVGLMCLVAITIRRFTLLAALDAGMMTFSLGILLWYFILGPLAPLAQEQGWLSSWREIFMILLRPVSSATFLLLCLIALSVSYRPPFTSLLSLSFLLYLVSDAVYVRLRASGPYEMDNWSLLIWALGFTMLAMAAVVSNSTSIRESRTQASSNISLWLGSLSPAICCGLLLAWNIFDPPVQRYVLLGGAAALAYLALRAFLTSSLAGKLRFEEEQAAVRRERGLISEELHDSLKQSVYGVSLLLGAYREAKDRGEADTAEAMLERAMLASREANFQVSRAIKELGSTPWNRGRGLS